MISKSQEKRISAENRGNSEITTTALANWYGSNRMLAKHVGEELRGCNWVGIPFAGGMCEIPHIDARQLLVNDKHRHVINLARVAKHPVEGVKLYRRLKRFAFHPDELAAAQDRCRARAELTDEPDMLFAITGKDHRLDADDRLEWATDYFISTWMSRGGKGGKPDEFRGGLPIRWNAGGGGSAVRYFSAVHSLLGWKRTLKRCEFTIDDAFDFLANVDDVDTNGLYADPPFPGPGDLYIHQLGPRGQQRLAESMSRFKRTRVVMRFYDVPLIRELYPEPRWTYVSRTGRAQSNNDKPEILILNGPSRAKVAA